MVEIVFTQVPVDDLIERITASVVEKICRDQPNTYDEQLISGDKARIVFDPEISRQTLSNWTRDGQIKSYRIGGRVFFKRSEIISAAKEMKKYKKPG